VRGCLTKGRKKKLKRVREREQEMPQPGVKLHTAGITLRNTRFVGLKIPRVHVYCVLEMELFFQRKVYF
jgi:hypothetical protein